MKTELIAVAAVAAILILGLGWFVFLSPHPAVQKTNLTANLTSNLSAAGDLNSSANPFQGAPEETTATFPSDVYTFIPTSVPGYTTTSSPFPVNAIRELGGCVVDIGTSLNSSITQMKTGDTVIGLAQPDNQSSRVDLMSLVLQKVWFANNANESQSPLATFQLVQGTSTADIFSLSANASYMYSDYGVNLTVLGIGCAAPS